MTWRGHFLRHFLKTPFEGPNGAIWSQNGSKKDPKNCQKIGILGNTETSILAPVYNTSSIIAPPRSFPKLMRKSDIIKIDLKYVNTRKIVPKWVPKWSSFFPGFGQKWHQNLMWIPKWPQRMPGDPKMDPEDLT